MYVCKVYICVKVHECECRYMCLCVCARERRGGERKGEGRREKIGRQPSPLYFLWYKVCLLFTTAFSRVAGPLCVRVLCLCPLSQFKNTGIADVYHHSYLLLEFWGFKHPCKASSLPTELPPVLYQLLEPDGSKEDSIKSQLGWVNFI